MELFDHDDSTDNAWKRESPKQKSSQHYNNINRASNRMDNNHGNSNKIFDIEKREDEHVSNTQRCIKSLNQRKLLTCRKLADIICNSN